MHDMIYSLLIVCPFCGQKSERESTAPFIYLDERGLQAHSSHRPGCEAEFANFPVPYGVTRTPNEYRQLPGDPQPPQTQGGA